MPDSVHFVILAVLFAALLHAGWNTLVKASPDGRQGVKAVALSAALLAVGLMPFLPWPARASWPFLLASALMQNSYYRVLGAVYRNGAMSISYPIMRGVSPVLVAAGGLLAIHENLSVPGWTGVTLITLGVLVMTVGHQASGRMIALSLLNAVLIASYTLLDGMGVRRSGAPLAYTDWVFIFSGIPMLWGSRLWQSWRLIRLRVLGLGLIGGACIFASYFIALWAMTALPVAVVGALRVASIPMATVMSALILREGIGWQRVAATITIASGTALLCLR